MSLTEEEKIKLNKSIQKQYEPHQKMAIAKNSSANRLHDCNGFCIDCPQHVVVAENDLLKIVACPIIVNEITFTEPLGRGKKVKK